MQRNVLGVLSIVLLVLCLLLGLLGCAQSQPTQTTSVPTTTPPATTTTIPTIKLRMGSPFPPPPAVAAAGVEYFEKTITEKSGGKITFENFWAGSLFTSGESFDAIQKNVTDLSLTSSAYAPSKLPMWQFEGTIPFRPNDAALYLKVFRKLRQSIPILDQEAAKNNAKLLASEVFMTGYNINSKVPITTVADMKGKKLGVIGTEFPKWVADSGAVPVTMPIADRYVALQQGILDGSFMLEEFVVDMKHYEVAKHYTLAGLGNLAPGGLWINLERFNSFSPEVQKWFIDAAVETENYWLKTKLDKAPKYRETLQNSGVNIVTMPESEKTKWANMMSDYPAMWAKANEAQGGWQLIETFLKLCSDEGYTWPRKWGQK